VSERDTSWERKEEIEDRFRHAIEYIRDVARAGGEDFVRTRLRNQADFYSLFGAVSLMEGNWPGADVAARRLLEFIRVVESDTDRDTNTVARQYFDAARSASNDAGPRGVRIQIIGRVLEDITQLQ